LIPYTTDNLKLEDFVRDRRFTMQSNEQYNGYCFITKDGEYRSQIINLYEYSDH